MKNKAITTEDKLLIPEDFIILRLFSCIRVKAAVLFMRKLRKWCEETEAHGEFLSQVIPTSINKLSESFLSQAFWDYRRKSWSITVSQTTPQNYTSIHVAIVVPFLLCEICEEHIHFFPRPQVYKIFMFMVLVLSSLQDVIDGCLNCDQSDFSCTS